MIRESEHFHFAGRKSTDFGIRNVSISDGGLYDEQIVANRSIEEVFIAGREDPYFIGTTEEPRTIQLRFYFYEGYNDRLIDEVIRWLNVKTYQPLYFSENVDRVYYAQPVDGISKLHNGLKEGYLSLNFRCNSGKSYSHEIRTPLYVTRLLAEEQGVDNPIIKLSNKGHYSTFPKMWIYKSGEGDIVIRNKTNKNEEFRFENIQLGESLVVDCAKETIDTDKINTYRYDDFNDNYLELVYGENELEVSSNVRIRFKYRYVFS